MTYTEFVKRSITFFAIGAAFLGFWYLRNIFIIAFLSSIIAISLSIPVAKLQEYGFKRGSSIAITLLSVVILLILFVTWILPVLVSQMVNLVDGLPAAFDATIDVYNDWYVRQDDSIQEALPLIDRNNLEETLGLEPDQRLVDPGSLASFALPVVTGAGNLILAFLANIAVVILVAIFLLLDPMDYTRGFISLIPPDQRKRALEVMVEVRIAITAWMAALSLSITITIFLVWLLLGMVLGVPNALALGVIAGLATIVPNIGAIIPIVPISIFTLADEPRKLPIVLATYLLIQQIEGNLITPYFVKRQLNIPTGALFLFQIVSAAIFGALGVILAVPLLATLITLIRELYVYDTLGMKGVGVDIEHTEEGKLRLVSREMKLVSVPVEVIDSTHPPEDPLYSETD
jgi:predicted PurR-regulated permease PerM